MSHHHKLLTIHRSLAILSLLLFAGCPHSGSDSKQTPTARPLEGVKLRLAVVNDPAMAAAIGRLRGEWNAQTGATLELTESSEADLARVETLPTDAVICPSHMLGPIAERKLIAPVPGSLLRGNQWAGIFELLKLREAAWGRQTMGIPFGSPVLCCYYRADLLEKLGRRPPRTWAEYEELVATLAKQKPADAKGAWCGSIEPLAPGWAGLTLLARVAPSIKHRDNYSALFNIETMEPLISGPPMVQALEELVAATKHGPTKPLAYDPAAARAAFWRGECAMALSWPTAAEAGKTGQGSAEKAGSKARVGFAELPGSRRVFNLTGRAWETRADDEDSRVPLLAIAGRVGVVNAKSSATDAAFQLLLWLSDDRNSPQVSAASPCTTLFRQANLKMPGQWVEKPVAAPAAVKYADVTEAAFRHEQWLGALRLPGRAEYLAALDEAVASAVRGEKPPLEALLDADAKWRKITERLGLEKQKAAYRHSLGLD
ncbi:MAG: extracellular solute-binding protein [Planctomycetaceae bacterium]|nr:extracellular solute-binding protein [Planctomycetaceae bacterium]